MTPEEVQKVVIFDYIGPIWHDSAWSRGVVHVLRSYDAFADFTYPLVEQLADEAQCRGEAKIGYVKARATTGLWELSGGNPTDRDYLRALKMILQNCRLNDAAQGTLHAKLSYGNSAAPVSPVSPTQPIENTMNFNTTTPAPAFTTVSYVYGRPVKDLSEAELISAIKGVEAEIAALLEINVKSTKIAAKVDELEAMMASIVTALDAK